MPFISANGDICYQIVTNSMQSYVLRKVCGFTSSFKKHNTLVNNITQQEDIIHSIARNHAI